jgi:hypothetical protein
MLHPPETHVPREQLALAPLQVMLQPLPQEAISQVLPSLQLLIWHPPLLHAAM